MIEEQPAAVLPPGVIPGTGDWDALLAAAQELEDYDYQAYIDHREYDRRHTSNRSAARVAAT